MIDTNRKQLLGKKTKKTLYWMFQTAVEEELMTPTEVQWVFTILDIAVRRRRRRKYERKNDPAGSGVDTENKALRSTRMQGL